MTKKRITICKDGTIISREETAEDRLDDMLWEKENEFNQEPDFNPEEVEERRFEEFNNLIK